MSNVQKCKRDQVGLVNADNRFGNQPTQKDVTKLLKICRKTLRSLVISQVYYEGSWESGEMDAQNQMVEIQLPKLRRLEIKMSRYRSQKHKDPITISAPLLKADNFLVSDESFVLKSNKVEARRREFKGGLIK